MRDSDLEDAPLSRCAVQRSLLKSLKDYAVVRKLSLLAARRGSKKKLSIESSFDWHVAQPCLLVKHFADKSAAFADLLDQTLQKHTEPLSIIIYYDEITVGNIIKVDTKRKFWCFYFSFAEFGRRVLQSDMALLPIGIIRSTKVKMTKGNLSAVFRECLKLFCGDGAALGSHGIAINLPSGPALLRAKVRYNMADAAALHKALDTKTCSGNVPCLRCKNVVSKRSRLAEFDASGYLVDTTCADASKFDARSDADVWRACDDLEAKKRRLRGKELADNEIAHGIKYNPHGVLFDKQLRQHFGPTSTWYDDAMHTYWSNGIVNKELWLVLGRLKQQKVSMDLVRDWMDSGFRFPKFISTQPASFFVAERMSDQAKEFKGTAAEMLVALPILNHFLVTVVAKGGILEKERKSLAALTAACSGWRRAKAGLAFDHRKLREEAETHLSLFIRAYGREHVVHKHHQELHLAEQIANGALVYDCFGPERKNKSLKIAATSINNSQHESFERSVLAKAVLTQLRTLQERGFDSHLVGKATEYNDSKLARSAYVNGMRVQRDDVLLRHADAGLVKACVMLADGLVAVLVQPLVCTGREPHGC